ncbi:UTP6 [Hepatospora eriocheir]|uniref:UTP6 n=1 Tax=Hepatospora eriocheir TaxID=1081669 RepID=A0A1X0QDG7_9MICR|nr:UTP6 [Hepatospora eriocheir]
MVKSVQNILESFVPELKGYKDRSVFNSNEIHNIVEKRRHFELKMLRRLKKITDFVAYIKSEEKIRKLRNKRIIKVGTNTIQSDFILERNILSIYIRAMRLFEETSLIKSFVDFCISTGFESEMKRILNEKCMKKPNDRDLWIFAAKKCSDINDIELAREFFIKAISLCDDKEHRIYIEFFRVEVNYMKTLIKFNKDMGIKECDYGEVEKGNVALAVLEEFIDKVTELDLKELAVIAKNFSKIKSVIEEKLKNE